MREQDDPRETIDLNHGNTYLENGEKRMNPKTRWRRYHPRNSRSSKQNILITRMVVIPSKEGQVPAALLLSTCDHFPQITLRAV